ncbi:hypothetical protein RHGRI_017464 [Rhododendron griersonianum]|uniref:DUF4283 domain-containing protein n=1 Tax=Rhododendron griersonianum TaxID=479676 RepID=A0AAV6JXX7_9ERIC|nr:hypothetical protein RHGRI_017464 [Rhododendron griersonianum]
MHDGVRFFLYDLTLITRFQHHKRGYELLQRKVRETETLAALILVHESTTEPPNSPAQSLAVICSVTPHPTLCFTSINNNNCLQLVLLVTSVMAIVDHFPILSSLDKNPKNAKNPKNPNSSSVMNVIPSISGLADTGVHSVKLLDHLEAVSSPEVPILTPEGSPCHESVKLKWAEVVAPPSSTSSSSHMNLSYYPPQLRDAKVVVCPPQEVIDLGSELWTDCVVGYFLDKKVPFPIVKNIIMRIWEKFGISDVLANDQGFFFFKFSKADAYRTVMKAGPWLIAGKLLILKPWEPQMVLTKEKLNDLTEKGKRLSFAKICVEINVDSPLLDVVEVEYANGASAFINVKYPWKPSCCSECHVFGHTEASHKVKVAEDGGPKTAPATFRQAHLSPKKTFRSPAVDFLMPQGNTVVMTNGVASDLVVKGRGMAPCPSPTRNGSCFPAIEMVLESTALEDGISVPAIEMAPVSPLLEECSASSDLVPLVTKKAKGKDVMGSTARIILAWDSLVLTVNILAFSSQMVLAKVTSVEWNKDFIVSVIYGANGIRDRRQLWAELRTAKFSIGNAAWVQLSDFNIVRKPTE